jgi:serine/threonine protein kinase
VFIPLLDGLKLIHAKGLLHLDIKPGNIYLRPGGNPLLLDFGAVHEMQQSRQFQPGQVLTPGFCPPEQSRSGGYVGPWSDIYAIGATMRACIEGRTPPPSTTRYMHDTMIPAVDCFRKGYSRELLAAIDWAMDVDQELRPQNVEQLLEALDARKSHVTTEKKRRKSDNDSVLRRLTNSLPWGKGPTK